MTRGGLIFPVMAEILPFVGSEDVDTDFKEPLRSGDHEGAYGKSYLVACQVEPDVADAIAMQPNGDDPANRLHLVFNHPNRGKAGPAPQPRDRLLALRSMRGELLQDFESCESLYACEVVPLSFGLFRGRSKVNLLRVAFQSRSHAVRRLG
jgi:hypothetical protein